MTPPDAARLFVALDATWPAARFVEAGPWRLREGLGGGQRVSSATAEGAVSEADIATAEAGLMALGQRPLFMIRGGDAALDGWLDARGYDVVDPVVTYLAATADLAEAPGSARIFPCWPPLAAQAEIWAEAGIGPARIAVMERVRGAKAALLARGGERPAGVAFVACDGDVAMLHALEVAPASRRHGIGRRVMTGAAYWAAREGAEWLALAVTRANAPANALYRSLGMSVAGQYHYRRAPKAGR